MWKALKIIIKFKVKMLRTITKIKIVNKNKTLISWNVKKKWINFLYIIKLINKEKITISI